MGISYTAGGIGAADIAPEDIVAGFVDSDNILYVDVGQTASTETGSRGQPYKTIQAAIAAVIAAGTNSDTVPHLIMVAPGTYAENLLLENVALYNLTFVAYGGKGSVIINPGTGDALASGQNNDHLHRLRFYGFTFNDPIDFDGPADDTYFLSEECLFEDCELPTPEITCLSVINANRITWKNGGIHIRAVIELQNVWLAKIIGDEYGDIVSGAGAPGATTVKALTASPMPYYMKAAHDGDDRAQLRIRFAYVQRDPTITATGGHVTIRVEFAQFGFIGWTLPSGCALYTRSAVLTGTVTEASGSEIWVYNSYFAESDGGTTRHVYVNIAA